MSGINRREFLKGAGLFAAAAMLSVIPIDVDANTEASESENIKENPVTGKEMGTNSIVHKGGVKVEKVKVNTVQLPVSEGVPDSGRPFQGAECIAKEGLDTCAKDQYCKLLKDDPDNAEKARAGNCAPKQ